MGTRGQSIAAFDWLRFLAAAGVLLHHARGASLVDFGALPASQHNLINAGWFAVTRLGHEAVLVFFILSGYLVGGRALDLAMSGRFDLRRYAIDRCVRIGIVLIPAIAFTGLAGYMLGQPVPQQELLGSALSL